MAMPESNSRPAPTTRVEIYDQGYTIGGANDADYVQALAERVDAKMRQVARETRVVDSLRVAVLAALNLADENERLRRRLSSRERQISERAHALSQDLDVLLRS